MKRYQGVAAVLFGCTFFSFSAIADVGFYIGLEAGQGRTQLDTSNSSVAFSQGILLDTSSDREDTTAGVYGGYSFSDHFAVELAYADLGEATYTSVRQITPFPFPFPFPFPASGIVARLDDVPSTYLPYPGTVNYAALPIQRETLTLDSKALSFAISGRYEIAGGFSLLGRAGLAAHQTKSSIAFTLDGNPVRVIGGKRKTSSGAAVVGFGGEWSFHANWAVRLQAQRHLLLEDDDLYPVDRGDVTTFTAGIEYRF